MATNDDNDVGKDLDELIADLDAIQDPLEWFDEFMNGQKSAKLQENARKRLHKFTTGGKKSSLDEDSKKSHTTSATDQSSSSNASKKRRVEE